MIDKEYRCKAHGDFVAPDDGNVKCPAKGCRLKVTQVFLTPPAVHFGKGKAIDRINDDIAASLDASDMSNRGGTFTWKKNQRAVPAAVRDAHGIVRDEKGQIVNPGGTYGFSPETRKGADGKKTFSPSAFGVLGGARTGAEAGFVNPAKEAHRHIANVPHRPEDFVKPA